MGHGSRAFLHSVNLIWTKGIDHIFFFKIILSKKSLEMWVATFYSFPISSFSLSHLSFFFFFSFHFFFFSLFCTLYKQSHIVDKERNNYLLRWLCIGVCIFDSTSVERSSFNFKVWNEEICIVCSHLWIHVEKKKRIVWTFESHCGLTNGFIETWFFL
jgi:hypothetical protein